MAGEDNEARDEDVYRGCLWMAETADGGTLVGYAEDNAVLVLEGLGGDGG